MKRWFAIVAVAALLVAGGTWLVRAPTPGASAASPLSGIEAVLYKSPTCGCCGSYAEFLTRHGVRVTEVADDDAVARAKREHGVPPHGRSCHTVEIDGYVVEGHVPLEALEALLSERPDVDGVALPGMPVGTPGMPGTPSGPIDVLTLDDGVLRPFMTL